MKATSVLIIPPIVSENVNVWLSSVASSIAAWISGCAKKQMCRTLMAMRGTVSAADAKTSLAVAAVSKNAGAYIQMAARPGAITPPNEKMTNSNSRSPAFLTWSSIFTERVQAPPNDQSSATGGKPHNNEGTK